MVKEANKEVTVANLLSKYSDEEICGLIDSLQEYRKQKTQLRIPISVFSNPDLGILESVVKFLKENHSMSYASIAKALNRDQRTIWTSYNTTLRKAKQEFAIKAEEPSIPISIFSDRIKSPMQSLVLHLHHSHLMRFKDIASTINRDYGTIWSSYHNCIKKRSQ